MGGKGGNMGKKEGVEERRNWMMGKRRGTRKLVLWEMQGVGIRRSEGTRGKYGKRVGETTQRRG
jgi:hypothetical protein